jgi:HlyD family secretion protein
MPKPTKEPLTSATVTPKKGSAKWKLIAALIIVAAALGLVVWRMSGRPTVSDKALATAQRGPLDITVLEGGNIKALESQDIKCEVRVGYQGTKVLKIIEEGYQVSDEDVRTNKVLVVLDGSELEKQIVQQDIQVESAAANLTDSQEAYDIQLNQNISDTQAAEQKARFARMDFDKFLGENVTEDIVANLGLAKMFAAEEANAQRLTDQLAVNPVEAMATNGSRGRPTGGLKAVSLTKPAMNEEAQKQLLPRIKIVDFSRYAKLEVLGDGEAKQTLRKCEDDLQTAQKEFGQSRATLAGTKRLFDKGFVTRIDLDRDDIANENARLKVQTAETARDLFLKYDFTHKAEDLLSKYSEAAREYERARKAAVSKLAQAEAKLKSSQAQYNVQMQHNKELRDQLEKCTIHAKKAGLVAYGGEEERWGRDEPIREGATIRENQTIITIPDMRRMSVTVRIHETYIKKIKKGQKARVTVDAYPDQVMDGEVTKVAVLPDSQNMWLNPDLKVYVTSITIAKTYEWLKPGMSAKVEIMVDHLNDVVYVPIQAVTPGDGKQLCYVAKSGSTEQRQIQVGQFNDLFIEIKNGLQAGEKVLLHPPDSQEPNVDDKKPIDAPKPPATPATKRA